MLSGRSQRGDSAWNKTLDHLLSLINGTLNIATESARVKSAFGPNPLEQIAFRRQVRAVETARAPC